MANKTVMGIDGWKSGWVAIVLVDGRFVHAGHAGDLSTLLASFPEVVTVGIDMPIGFPTSEARRADVAARVLVGPRRSSVFPMVPEDLGAAGAAPVDDILDAAACAWSAERVRTKHATTAPDDPEPGEPVIRF